MKKNIALSLLVFCFGCNFSGIKKSGEAVRPLPFVNNLDLKNNKKTALLLDQGAGDINRPEVVIDSSGKALSVFEKFDGQKNNIYAVTAKFDSPWSEPQLISNGRGNAYRPLPAISLTGAAFVVFVQQEENNLRLYAVRYNPANSPFEKGGPGGFWENPITIDPGQGMADGARIVINDLGTVYVVFEFFDGRGSKIFINQYTEKEGWGKAQNVDQRTGNAYYPQIALIDNAPVVIFIQEQSDDWAVLSRRYVEKKNGWDETERVDKALKIKTLPPSEYTEGLYAHQFVKKHWWEGPSKVDARVRYSNTPQIAVDQTKGEIFTVFRKWDGRQFRVGVNIYNLKNGWGKAKYIDYGNGDAGHPAIVLNPEGKAVIVFIQKNKKVKGDFSRVYTIGYNSNDGWQKPMIIDQGEGDAYGPRLVLAGKDQLVAVWCQWKNNLVRSWITPYESGKGWGLPVITNPDILSTCGTRITANRQGQIITVFEQEMGQGKDNQIFGARFLFP